MQETRKAAPRGARPIGGAALAIIAATIALEGGYVRNSADPGGETNMGVTKVTARSNGYTGPMRTLPRATAESIYYDQYLVKPGYEPLITIDAPVTSELFDSTVNMGPFWPSMWFEQSTNELCGTRLKADGHVGPAAIAAYRACQPRRGAARLCVDTLFNLDLRQAAYYHRLVAAKPGLHVFLRGWLKNRIGNVDRRDCARPAKR